jgi:hypothetical protein
LTQKYDLDQIGQIIFDFGLAQKVKDMTLMTEKMKIKIKILRTKGTSVSGGNSTSTSQTRNIGTYEDS